MTSFALLRTSIGIFVTVSVQDAAVYLCSRLAFCVYVRACIFVLSHLPFKQCVALRHVVPVFFALCRETTSGVYLPFEQALYRVVLSFLCVRVTMCSVRRFARSYRDEGPRESRRGACLSVRR